MATSKVTVHFRCPVEQVWQTVTDLTHTTWRSDLGWVELLDGGPLRGARQRQPRCLYGV